MTCDEAIRAIEAMIDREIDDDERMQLEGHLAGCETCRREVEERRAFSEQVGRDLNEAFGSAVPPARPVIVRPRRFPWARMAAVIVIGVVIGYVGSSTGLFRPASAEAREVATLSALKEAYEVRNDELENRLERAATALDRRASRAPEGPVRDAVTLCLMNAATGLAGEQPLELPTESPERTRRIAMHLSSEDWATRGLAVQATRRLATADLPHMENQIFLLNGTNRTFTELVVTSMRASTRPAVTVEIGEGALHFVQLQNGAVRVETAGQAPAVCEANSILDFRVRYPEVARKLGVRGVDGYYQVAGVVQRTPGVESRPAAYVPAVVWNSQAVESPAIVEALNVHAVMAENARAGRSLEEIERRASEVLRLYNRVAKAPPAVEPDPARVRLHLARLSKADVSRLMLAREKLQDDVAALERHAADMQRRLDYVSTATVTLDYVQAPK